MAFMQNSLKQNSGLSRSLHLTDQKSQQLEQEEPQPAGKSPGLGQYLEDPASCRKEVFISLHFAWMQNKVSEIEDSSVAMLYI